MCPSPMRQLAVIFMETSWYVYEVPASREDGIVPATPAEPGSTSSSCVVCVFLEWQILRIVRPSEYWTNRLIIDEVF